MTPQVGSEGSTPSEPRLTVANNLRGDGRNGTKADNGEEGCEHDPLCHGFLPCQTFQPPTIPRFRARVCDGRHIFERKLKARREMKGTSRTAEEPSVELSSQALQNAGSEGSGKRFWRPAGPNSPLRRRVSFRDN
jgi:hypothetical protein